MLDELDIRNFAIIDQLHIHFADGLTVLTGETGAGKSIIIDALGLLLGGRASADLVRDGEAQARVEGVFALREDTRLAELLAEYGIEDEEGVLILAREIARTGRSSARVNGRVAPVSLLQRLGERLVDIHGQTEHLALLRAGEQLDMLDRFAGLTTPRESMATVVRRLRAIRGELARLSGDEREAARRLDLLQFQVEEVDAAAPTPGEEERLEGEARLLASAEKLRLVAGQLHGVLAGGDADAVSAEDVLGSAVQLAGDLARLDPAQQETATRLESIMGDVQDLARTVRRYADGVEEDPERLAQVQERQELLRALKRKYGATVAEILTFRDAAAAEAAAISHSDERRQELQEEEARVAAEAGRVAAALSAARERAATRLAERVQQELAGLNMGGASFEVRLYREPDPNGLAAPPSPDGPDAPDAGRARAPQLPASPQSGDDEVADDARYAFDATGVDHVEFLVAPNVGEPPKPVARIASGGETSRIMLAMKSALSEADQTATLVFDEVDVGVGGRSGAVIGEKLWLLARRHQVLCITHLPQVAVFADSHQKILKVIRDGRTTTQVETLPPPERIDEVAQMLGGPTITRTTRGATHDLLSQAEQWKARVADG